MPDVTHLPSTRPWQCSVSNSNIHKNVIKQVKPSMGICKRKVISHDLILNIAYLPSQTTFSAILSTDS